jgi:long-chain acyl-CoA synthetase
MAHIFEQIVFNM